MTKTQAIEWVKSHTDEDDLDESNLEAAFTAIFDRKPDDEDWEQGLWSHLCAAVECEVRGANYTISGSEAIRLAERDGLTLRKYADPVEGERDGLTPGEALAVVREDSSLIYVIARPTGWTGDAAGHNVSDYFRDGKYLGADCDGIEPTWEDAQ